MAKPSIDTQKSLEITGAPGKMLLLVFGGLAFVATGYLMTLASEDTYRQSATVVRLIGYVSIAFFGLCALIGMWRLLTLRGPVILISPAGFRDVRVTHDVVPWPAVQSVQTWSHSGQRIMIVALKPGEEAKLKLTRIARMSRGANARLGADGLAVTALGAKISHDTLIATTLAYVHAHGGD